MVDGHEKISSATSPFPLSGCCAVVDLDGTLIRGNSLRMLIRFLAARLRKRGDYAPLMKIAALLAARRLRLISHRSMKYPLHSLAVRTLTDAEIGEFVGMLLTRLNLPLLRRLEELKASGCMLILATAAPSLCVPALCSAIGFDKWIATPLSPQRRDYTEARGAVKKSLSQSLAGKLGVKITFVVTDHEDDLPLLSLPGVERLLVNPTTRLRLLLAAASLDYKEVRTL